MQEKKTYESNEKRLKDELLQAQKLAESTLQEKEKLDEQVASLTKANKKLAAQLSQYQAANEILEEEKAAAGERVGGLADKQQEAQLAHGAKIQEILRVSEELQANLEQAQLEIQEKDQEIERMEKVNEEVNTRLQQKELEVEELHQIIQALDEEKAELIHQLEEKLDRGEAIIGRDDEIHNNQRNFLPKICQFEFDFLFSEKLPRHDKAPNSNRNAREIVLDKDFLSGKTSPNNINNNANYHSVTQRVEAIGPEKNPNEIFQPKQQTQNQKTLANFVRPELPPSGFVGILLRQNLSVDLADMAERTNNYPESKSHIVKSCLIQLSH